jgi:putative Mn2+ efflux pump MntP
MVIIDLMAVTMGVAMGFLAFLVIGGLTGVFALHFYPGQRRTKPKAKKFLIAALISFLAALASSYVGQFSGLFQSGQMLEWLSAIVVSSLVCCLYAAVSRKAI